MLRLNGESYNATVQFSNPSIMSPFDDAAPEQIHDNAPIPPVPPELYHAEHEQLEAGVRRSLDNLEQEVLGKPLEKMSPEEMAQAADTMRQGELDYLERQTHNPDAEIARRAEFVRSMKEPMDALIDRVNDLIKQGEHGEAEKQVKEFLSATRQDMEARNLKGEAAERALAQMQLLIDLDVSLIASQEKGRSLMLSLLSMGMDMVPFLGGVKMMAEGVRGETLDGEKLEGIRRLAHMGEGLFWEFIDVLATIAAFFSGGAGGVTIEGATKLSRVLMRTGAFMRKFKIEGSKEIFRTGRFLEQYKSVGRVAQSLFEKGLRQRSATAAKVVEKVVTEGPKKLRDLRESQQTQAEVLQAINDERAELTRLFEEIAPTSLII